MDKDYFTGYSDAIADVQKEAGWGRGIGLAAGGATAGAGIMALLGRRGKPRRPGIGVGGAARGQGRGLGVANAGRGLGPGAGAGYGLTEEERAILRARLARGRTAA